MNAHQSSLTLCGCLWGLLADTTSQTLWPLLTSALSAASGGVWRTLVARACPSHEDTHVASLSLVALLSPLSASRHLRVARLSLLGSSRATRPPPLPKQLIPLTPQQWYIQLLYKLYWANFSSMGGTPREILGDAALRRCVIQWGPELALHSTRVS